MQALQEQFEDPIKANHAQLKLQTIFNGLPAEYQDLAPIFEAQEVDNLPPHCDMDCAVELLPGQKLPKAKLYSMNLMEWEELRKFIDQNLKHGFIHPANSPQAAPMLFQKKEEWGLRLCTDYRGLNAVSMSNPYPVPLIKGLLGAMAKGEISKLDLKDAYFCVRIKEGEEWKMAFNTPLGHFEYLVMPFGLQGVPGMFMNLINDVLHKFLFKRGHSLTC